MENAYQHILGKKSLPIIATGLTNAGATVTHGLGRKPLMVVFCQRVVGAATASYSYDPNHAGSTATTMRIASNIAGATDVICLPVGGLGDVDA